MMNFYTIGKQLGAGSYGVTYLCTLIATGKQYACKCISKCNLVSQKKCEMVEREIDILMLINLKEHPNIISIKDVWEDDTHIRIVMELCEGGSLYDRMVEYGTFDEPRAAQMIKEIASAIETYQDSGIVHRDLNLQNLMFETKNKDSALKVIDFGLAQYFQHGEALVDVVGTPIYTAPEVMEGHHGPKVDIWSAGVVLYVLLAGFAPFKGHTFEEVYEEVMKCNDIFAKNPWPHISKGAKDLIQKMLMFNVNERFSALEVLKHPWILENSSRLEESRRKYVLNKRIEVS